MTIEKGLIGFNDISFGTGTFQRKSQSGQLITLDQIKASHVPILDSAGRFTGTDIEAALAETMTREESGSTVKKLTNRSGAQRVAGDVVIIDTSNDDSFTTTITAGNVLVLGVVLETVANLATGRIATGGYVGSVKVTGATIRGDYLQTSTTVLKAASSTTFAKGVFAIALSSSSSVVSAYLFGSVGAVDAQTLGGYSIGNGTGAVPVSNGTVNTNLNADMVDGLHSTDITGGAKLYAFRGTAQSIANATWTKVVYTSEEYDTGNAYDPATGCFSVPVAGYYHFEASGVFASNATGFREIRIVRGAVCGTITSDFIRGHVNNNGAALSVHLQISVDFYFPGSGTYVWVEVYQDSGGALNFFSATNANNVFIARKIDRI